MIPFNQLLQTREELEKEYEESRISPEKYNQDLAELDEMMKTSSPTEYTKYQQVLASKQAQEEEDKSQEETSQLQEGVLANLAQTIPFGKGREIYQAVNDTLSKYGIDKPKDYKGWFEKSDRALDELGEKSNLAYGLDLASQGAGMALDPINKIAGFSKGLGALNKTGLGTSSVPAIIKNILTGAGKTGLATGAVDAGITAVNEANQGSGVLETLGKSVGQGVIGAGAGAIGQATGNVLGATTTTVAPKVLPLISRYLLPENLPANPLSANLAKQAQIYNDVRDLAGKNWDDLRLSKSGLSRDVLGEIRNKTFSTKDVGNTTAGKLGKEGILDFIKSDPKLNELFSTRPNLDEVLPYVTNKTRGIGSEIKNFIDASNPEYLSKNQNLQKMYEVGEALKENLLSNSRVEGSKLTPKDIDAELYKSVLDTGGKDLAEHLALVQDGAGNYQGKAIEPADLVNVFASKNRHAKTTNRNQPNYMDWSEAQKGVQKGYQETLSGMLRSIGEEDNYKGLATNYSTAKTIQDAVTGAYEKSKQKDTGGIKSWLADQATGGYTNKAKELSEYLPKIKTSASPDSKVNDLITKILLQDFVRNETKKQVRQ